MKNCQGELSERSMYRHSLTFQCIAKFISVDYPKVDFKKLIGKQLLQTIYSDKKL